MTGVPVARMTPPPSFSTKHTLSRSSSSSSASSSLCCLRRHGYDHFDTSPCSAHEKSRAFCSAFGGEDGIRTHVRLPSNGFQDRLVMTTSIPLQILFSCTSTASPTLRSDGFQDRCVACGNKVMTTSIPLQILFSCTSTASPTLRSDGFQDRYVACGNKVMTTSITLRVNYSVVLPPLLRPCGRTVFKTAFIIPRFYILSQSPGFVKWKCGEKNDSEFR